MNNISISDHQVHIWRISLAISDLEVQTNLAILSEDEIKRANRYKFIVHKRRYVAARTALRTLLAFYLKLPARDIQFSYGEHGKPALTATTKLRFNVSHSEDLALIAFTEIHDLGIDVERVADTYNPSLAKRYFSSDENKALDEYPDKLNGFYRLWSRKEAFIKAIGKGLSQPLKDFSVSLSDEPSEIRSGEARWKIVPLLVQNHFQAALACDLAVEEILYWQWSDDGHPQLIRRVPV